MVDPSGEEIHIYPLDPGKLRREDCKFDPGQLSDLVAGVKIKIKNKKGWAEDVAECVKSVGGKRYTYSFGCCEVTNLCDHL